MNAQERFESLEKLPFRSTTSERSIRGSWAASVDVLRHREMLGLLVRRDLKSRYKNSTLGFVWSLIRPLTQLAIYYVVLGQFLGAARGIPDFAIYIFAGLTAYGLFSEIVGGATTSILSNSGLIKKVQLPREVFPLASVGSALFNFVVQLTILIVVVIVVWLVGGTSPLTTDLLYFFPSVALLLVYGTAFGLLLSALNVYLRDIGYLVEVLLMLLMWASPIVYAWEFVRNEIGQGLLLEVYTNNPITLAVLGFHEAFWAAGTTAQTPGDLLIRMLVALGIGLLLLFGAQRVFSHLQGNFAQEI